MIKGLLSILIILNLLILLGMLWPEGAPPFAPVVNMLTLVLNVAFLTYLLRMRKDTDKADS
jgi:hypothetical protein